MTINNIKKIINIVRYYILKSNHIMQRRKNRKLNFQFTARNDRILSERVRRSEADAGASLKFYHSGRHTAF